MAEKTAMEHLREAELLLKQARKAEAKDAAAREEFFKKGRAAIGQACQSLARHLSLTKRIGEKEEVQMSDKHQAFYCRVCGQMFFLKPALHRCGNDFEKISLSVSDFCAYFGHEGDEAPTGEGIESAWPRLTGMERRYRVVHLRFTCGRCGYSEARKKYFGEFK